VFAAGGAWVVLQLKVEMAPGAGGAGSPAAG